MKNIKQIIEAPETVTEKVIAIIIFLVGGTLGTIGIIAFVWIYWAIFGS
jgi:hypothetical protein